MEERLTHKKHQNGFPKLALQSLFDIAKCGPEEIDYVAYPFFDYPTQRQLLIQGYLKDLNDNLKNINGLGPILQHEWSYLRWTMKAISDHRRFNRELEENLAKLGLLPKLHRVEHQLAHAAAAFYTSGFEEALILTLDWYGDGLAGSISLGTQAGIKRILSIEYPHSLGLFYAQVTGALGFRMSHHEGKIVGLAAFGDKDKLSSAVRKKFMEREGEYRYLTAMDFAFSRKLARKYSREDVAAAYQAVLEEVVTSLVRPYLREHRQRALVCAGGVAANVKLNQRLHEMEDVRRIFIHPAMGDDGTGAGAALYLSAINGVRPKKLENVFLGPDHTDEQIKQALDNHGLSYQYFDPIEPEIARLLADNKVVARFCGRMEYGPRALGNRSILYPATDPKVNDWLNQRLQRTEFMPFAPATLSEHARQCYNNLEGAEQAAQYMTITFDCTPWMKEHSPAAVHVDGTARPQLVAPHTNPSFYRLLCEYRKLTRLPSLVNTSFNMHEAPMICSPEDAIQTFKDGKLDYLAIGNFLV